MKFGYRTLYPGGYKLEFVCALHLDLCCWTCQLLHKDSEIFTLLSSSFFLKECLCFRTRNVSGFLLKPIQFSQGERRYSSHTGTTHSKPISLRSNIRYGITFLASVNIKDAYLDIKQYLHFLAGSQHYHFVAFSLWPVCISVLAPLFSCCCG